MRLYDATYETFCVLPNHDEVNVRLVLWIRSHLHPLLVLEAALLVPHSQI